MVLSYRKKLLVVTCLFISSMFLFMGCNDGVGFYESSDISTYRNFGMPEGSTPPKINAFPENLEKAETINDYYFVANFPPFGSTSWEIFLDVTYSEENFYLELERLSNFQGRTRGLAFDSNEVLFNFPTYVVTYDARRDYGHAYVYISIDEPNLRMLYVSLDRPSRKNQRKHFREIVLSSEYQPKNYFQNQDLKTLDGYYYDAHNGLDSAMIWIEN
ncbi:MAG: hypothetical protein FWH03_06080 [Firmicutes bacterium]|nr:hypothetical protein [Bacillota bacterium]